MVNVDHEILLDGDLGVALVDLLLDPIPIGKTLLFFHLEVCSIGFGWNGFDNLFLAHSITTIRISRLD